MGDHLGIGSLALKNMASIEIELSVAIGSWAADVAQRLSTRLQNKTLKVMDLSPARCWAVTFNSIPQ